MSLLEICLVDDDDAVRHSLRMLLQRFGMHVTCYPSSNAFLKDGKIDGYHCLLFDNCMPELSGIELLEVLRARRLGTPAIIITASCDSSLTERAASAGAAAVLNKPLKLENLLGTIRQATGQSSVAQDDKSG